MCGFVGFVGDEDIETKVKIINEMMDRIAHRGPDSAGDYEDERIALGFRRLSIIGLTNGTQPMYNEDRSLVLVFNGEIYNYKELKKELIEAGHEFKTDADTEVLVHGYEEYGKTLVKKLRGMYAFAIWDKENDRLFAARDMFGIKPLYYYKKENRFVFGSEIKAFLSHPEFEMELSEKAMDYYFSFQMVPTDETFFKNVYSLPAAHYMIYEKGSLTVKRYWKPEFGCDSEKSFEEYVELIGKTMEESVEAHKISDVEVGSYLSSGIDSSYIACLGNVDKTFTVGFDNEKYNEITYATEFSKVIGVKNYNKLISSEEFFNEVPQIMYSMDEPLADPACIPLYFLGREAAKQVKVVLSGEGADEFFGGYNIYLEPLDTAWYDRIPLFLRKAAGGIASLFPKVKGFNFVVRHSKDLEDRYIGNANIFSEKEKKLLLKKKPTHKNTDVTGKYFARVKEKDKVTKMQYIDMHLWLVHDILLKADKMSMAHSLETRVPFLDRNVWEVASKLPQSYKVGEGATKRALRAAAKKKIPEKVANKKKLGFPVPIRVWLKEDRYYNRVKETLTGETAKQFFNTEYLVKLLDQHKAGKYDNSRKIWTVYVFILWYQMYFTKNQQEQRK